MGVLFKAKAAIEPDYMRKKKQAEAAAGHKLSTSEFEENYLKIGGGQPLE